MSQIYTIPCNRNEDVFIHAIPGHYVTASAHLNYYVGTSDIKHNRVVSVEAAKLLAEYYSVRNMDVDTVLCLYETQALGAYMAQELASPSMLAPNPDLQVYVLGPEYDTQGNMIFRDNLRRMIQGKNVVVLISCITSGRTVERAVQSARYYGGNVIGISSVFSAAKELCGLVASMVLRCDDCISYHVAQCREAGVGRDEMFEAFSIGLVVGGSIVIPHLRRAVDFLDQLEQGGAEAPSAHDHG